MNFKIVYLFSELNYNKILYMILLGFLSLKFETVINFIVLKDFDNHIIFEIGLSVVFTGVANVEQSINCLNR